MVEEKGEQERASLDSIGTAPVEMPPSEIVPKGENPLTGKPDPNLDRHLGLIGKLVGGGPEKAGNIASIVIFGALIGIVAACFGLAGATGEASEIFKLVIGGCFSLITGALGYLFGASTKENGS